MAPLPTCRACLHSAGSPDEYHFAISPPTGRLGAVSSGQLRPAYSVHHPRLHSQWLVDGCKRATVGLLQPQNWQTLKTGASPGPPVTKHLLAHHCPLHLKKLSKDKVPTRQALLSNQREQACVHFKKQQATGKDPQHF